MFEIKYIIGVIHLIVCITVTLYPFIFSKNSFDYIYIYYNFFVIISWCLLNGECILTYLVKKNNDINYVAGKNVLDNEDMYMTSNSKEIINNAINILFIVWMYSIYITMTRNKYPKYISILLIITCLFYKCNLHIYNNHHINKRFHFYQKIILCILIILLILTICNTNYNNILKK